MKNCLVALLFLGLFLGGTVLASEVENSYAGSEKCRRCHVAHYEGWRSTLHPYKFQKASPKTVIGRFSGKVIEAPNFRFRPFREKDRFFMEVIDDSGSKIYPIDYVIGEFWKQLYVTTFPNGELHILPGMWIVATQKWTVTKYWPKTIYQFSCAGCHNTGVEVPGPKAKAKEIVWNELGVGCEACHGPGARHVKEAENGGHVFGNIINPAKIPDARLAAMVCGRCHVRGKSTEGPFAYPVNYQPGKYLDFCFKETPKLHPDDFSKANRQQYIDWKKSKHAEAGVLCWDCHEVHRKGEANRYQTKLPGNSLCRSCHRINHIGVHGIHSVNNCVGCHMPPVGKRAVKGDVHSHRFQVIPPKETLQMGGLKKQPNSCNLCHHHQNDDPAKLQEILERIKTSGQNRNFYP